MNVKRFFIIGALLNFIVLGAQAQETTTLKLSLDDALRIALSESPTIQIADQEITKTEYAKKGTYAALFPQIDLNGQYQRTLKKQAMFMDTGSGSTKITIGMDNTWQGGLSAVMPLVSVSLWKSLQISAMDVELAIEKARSSRIDMIEQVSNAFYGVLLAKDSYVVYKEVYDNAVDNYNDVKQKFDVGKTSEYELIRANVSVKNAEPNLYSAENAIVLGTWQLKALLGIDLERNIECLGSLSDYEKFIEPHLANNASLENNSTLRQLEIQSRQLQKTLEIRKAANLPSLNFSFSYNYMSMNNNYRVMHYDWIPYSVAGLSLSVPIFAGGKRRSDIKQAKININQMELQRQNTERNLNVALLQSINSMNTSIKQHEAARSSVEQAEKSYAIAVRRYEIGNGTQLEINDSQLALTQARLNLNQSVYNYLVARTALNKVTGKSNK